MDIVTLEFTYGGISFVVDAEIEDDYVVSVQNVQVYTAGKEYVLVDLNDTEEFFRTFQDYIQEAYTYHLENLAISAAEARMDAEKEEQALENWKQNN